MSVKKVEKKRRDKGKEEKRPGAMRAPPRPRFQRPRTQLVHLLLDVQPPARVPGVYSLPRGTRRLESVAYPTWHTRARARACWCTGKKKRPRRWPGGLSWKTTHKRRRRQRSARSFARNIESEIAILHGSVRDRDGRRERASLRGLIIDSSSICR